MVENKEIYRNAEISVVLISASDIVTASTLSNDSDQNYDDGGWV